MFRIQFPIAGSRLIPPMAQAIPSAIDRMMERLGFRIPFCLQNQGHLGRRFSPQFSEFAVRSTVLNGLLHQPMESTSPNHSFLLVGIGRQQ